MRCRRQPLAGVLPLLALMAAAAAAAPGTNAPAASAAPTNGPDFWFPVGEELRYSVSWGILPVGETSAATSWVQTNGQRRLLIAYRARSNRVLRQIYPVDDHMTSLVDPDGFRSVEFRMVMREGRHNRHEVTTFDYPGGKAVWAPVSGNKTRTFSIDADTHDLLALMFYARRDGFRSGSNRTFRALADGKVRDLPVDVDGIENVRVPGYGKVECLRLKPRLEFEGFFVSTGGITAWVSNDRHCICTRANVSIPVGSITVELEEVRRPDGRPPWPKRSG
jgi:hypothetical protein